MRAPTILVFDSGLGGLSVLQHTVQARPDARIIYAADNAGFPYGHLRETDLVARVIAVMSHLIEAHAPDLVIVACNTASTIALPALRQQFTVPFIGTVPAIKPAAEQSVTRHFAVLGTVGTVQREYTQALIREFARDCLVTLVGAPELATLSESILRGESVADADLAREIAPCFVEADGRKVDVIALACTHYPLVLDQLSALAPWPVKWVDPAPAIGRRVIHLLGPTPLGFVPPEPAKAVFTGPQGVSLGLGYALAGRGIKGMEVDAFPLLATAPTKAAR